jgi:hypothetical protein
VGILCGDAGGGVHGPGHVLAHAFEVGAGTLKLCYEVAVHPVDLFHRFPGLPAAPVKLGLKIAENAAELHEPLRRLRYLLLH